MSEYEDSFASESKSAEEEKAHSYTSSERRSSENDATDDDDDSRKDSESERSSSRAASSSRRSSGAAASNEEGSHDSARDSDAASSSRASSRESSSRASSKRTSSAGDASRSRSASQSQSQSQSQSRATTADSSVVYNARAPPSKARAVPAESGTAEENPLASNKARSRSTKARKTKARSTKNRGASNTARSTASYGGSTRSYNTTARSVNTAPEPVFIEEAKVPETQEELDDMIAENERLKEDVYERQKDAYRASMKPAAPKETRKEEAARLVQESLMLEREAQILRQEKRDLLTRKARLADMIRRYKKSSQYVTYIEQAKNDLTVLGEDHRDMQLEIRCNEKLLLMHEEVLQSGTGDRKLAEEMRAQNALTQRAVQHSLRDADDAQRQRDAQKQRVDKLKELRDRRADAMNGGGYDELSQLRMEGRDATIRLDQLKSTLRRLHGGGGGGDAIRMQTSDQAESEYLKERIADLKAELRRRGQDPDGNGGAAYNSYSNRSSPRKEAASPQQQQQQQQPPQHEYQIASGSAAGQEQAAPYPTSAADAEEQAAPSPVKSSQNEPEKERDEGVDAWLGETPAAKEDSPKKQDPLDDIFGEGGGYPTESPAAPTADAGEENPSWLGGGGDDWMTGGVPAQKKPSIVMDEEEVFDANKFANGGEEEIIDEDAELNGGDNKYDELFGENDKKTAAAPAAASNDAPDWLDF